MKLTFETAKDNTEYIKIAKHATKKYRKYLTEEEAYSAQMIGLWDAVQKFDPGKGTKFTSYLYSRVIFAVKNYYLNRDIKYKDKHKSYEHGDLNSIAKSKKIYASINKVLELITDLDDEDRELLEKKFIYKKTYKEIAEEHGCCMETARRKIMKIIKNCV